MGLLHDRLSLVTLRSLVIGGSSDGWEAAVISQSQMSCCKLSGANPMKSTESSSSILLHEAAKVAHEQSLECAMVSSFC